MKILKILQSVHTGFLLLSIAYGITFKNNINNILIGILLLGFRTCTTVVIGQINIRVLISANLLID